MLKPSALNIQTIPDDKLKFYSRTNGEMDSFNCGIE